MYLRGLVLSIFCLSAVISIAQNVVLKNFTTNSGLPSSQIYDVIEDEYGFLWFSTDKGLSRYDGYSFKNYTIEDGLPDNVIFDFHKTSDGKIWCTTNSTQLFSIKGRVPVFEDYKYNDTIKKYAGDLITNGLYFDANNSLYLSFHHVVGYFKISEQGKLLASAERPASLLPSKYLINVSIDAKSEPFFFYTYEFDKGKYNQLFTVKHPVDKANSKNEAIYFENQAISVFCTEEGVILQEKDKMKRIDLDKVVISSGKLDENHFWIGLRYGGAKIFSLDGELKESFLSMASVTQVYQDQQGNIWATTLTKGAFCISNTSIKYIGNTKGNAVSSLSARDQDQIYVGFYNGNIDIVNSGGMQKHYYTPTKHQPATIYYHPSSKIHFFGSDILFSSDKRVSMPWSCSAIGIMNDNFLIAGSTGLHGVDLRSLEVSPTTFFRKRRIKDILELNNKLYAATLDGVVYITTLNSTEKHKQLLPNVRIDDITILGENLVIGTHGRGVQVLDKNHKTVHSISTKNGLSSNFISNIYTENDSTLWIATNNGLNRVIIQGSNNYRITQYNTTNGLLSNEVWAVLVQRNIVWIGTQNGLCYFSKSDVEAQQHKKRDYHLQWTSLKMGNTDIVHDAIFSHDQNNFEFSFLGIRLGGGKDLIYRYKLIGLSNKWRTTRNRTLIFPSLPKGSYKLIVQVRGDDDKWSDKGINYSFFISPPFWTTWWFITLCIVVVLILIYLFFKIKILSYNKDIVREILRYVLRKIRKDTPTVSIKHHGRLIQLNTEEIHYFKTSGNYIEIKTLDKNYLVRSSVADFMRNLPDAIEFIQVHRSFVVRLDKIQQKGARNITVLDEEIPIGRKYNESVKLIKIAVN